MSFPNYAPSISSDLGHRLIALIGIRLAIPVTPLPGEGLADIVFRAAHVNGLQDIGKRWGNPIVRDHSHLGITLASPDLQKLGDLLGTPNGDTDLSPIQFEKYVRGAPFGSSFPTRLPFARLCNFFGARIPTVQLLRSRRVSPQSLRGALVSKAIWHLSALTFEPNTHELLLDLCPGCHRQLDFKNAFNLYRCNACGTDFRDAEQPIVAVEDREALKFVTSLVDPESRDPHPQRHKKASILAEEDRGSLFMLCVFIGKVLDNNFNRHETGSLISMTGASVSPSNLSVAGRAILEWPVGFDKLNDKLKRILWENGILGEVRDPFRKYIQKHPEIFSKSILTSFDAAVVPKITIPAAGISEIRKPCVHDLAVQSSGNLDDHMLSLRNDVKTLHWSRGFISARRSTGLSRSVLSDFVISRSRLALSSDEMAQYLGELNNELAGISQSLPRVREHSLSLKAIIAALYLRMGSPWPGVLQAVIERRLPLAVSASRSSWIDSLRVEDFSVWAHFCRDLAPFAGTLELPLGWRDVAFHLNAPNPGFHRRFAHHFGVKKQLTLKDLYHFRTEHISASEISTLASIGGKNRTSRLIARELKRLGIPSCPTLAGFYSRNSIRDTYI
jgi:hypothetical protein